MDGNLRAERLGTERFSFKLDDPISGKMLLKLKFETKEYERLVDEIFTEDDEVRVVFEGYDVDEEIEDDVENVGDILLT